MVNQKPLGLAARLAVLPQALADRLALLARVGKDEALAAAGVLKDVRKPRIGSDGRCVARRLNGKRGRCGCSSLLSLIGLRRRRKEVLKRHAPDFLCGLKARDDRRAAASCGKKAPCGLGLSDRGRQSHAARIAARRTAEPLDKAEGLKPPVASQQRMDLVDHDKAQVAEEGREIGVLVDQEGLKRLGRDLKNARGVLHEPPLGGLRGFAVPTRDGDVARLAQKPETLKLIVDKGFERCDVEHTHAFGRIFSKKRQDRKERRLGLA